MDDAVRHVVEAGVVHVRRDVLALLARVGVGADAGHAVGERELLARGEVEFVRVPGARVEPHAAQQEVRGARGGGLADVGVQGLRRVAAGEAVPERVRGVDGVRARHGDREVGPRRVPARGVDLPGGAEVGRRDDDEVGGAPCNAGARQQHGRGTCDDPASFHTCIIPQIARLRRDRILLWFCAIISDYPLSPPICDTIRR